ncbi:MAG TPA: V-type ATP synthase subunit A [Candidatus Eisenbacteria bacterium]|jgi:V/A-type H+-transporting ATPase subunit A|nr:V-type ATP synthase subunit A [Candidatus Eisenbacteria bacterium]
MNTGEIERIAGSVITGTGINDIYIGEVVQVGDQNLIGEVIQLYETKFVVQVYEPTIGLRPGQKISTTGQRLVAELGPGLLMSVFDGIERPLERLLKISGHYLKRGIKVNRLPRDRKWHFVPKIKKGEAVSEGDVLGIVNETRSIIHKITVPYGMKGKLGEISEGDFTIKETIATVSSDAGDEEIKMLREWPVRSPRPFQTRLNLDKHLITGQRVIDVFFPIAKGGAASIPGGFGTGKTIMLHQFSKWADADIIVYIGCGERGNEICEVITGFPKLKDPRTGFSLIERLIMIANTSNMPVAAREASIYMGITMAEYYRDMGYNIAVMADSTSRWAEALRELSGRLEEMPSERGYPAYLSSRIAEFYERAGRVKTLGNPEREGSVSIIGAVSPPGGDFNEPVTIHTSRFTGVFWALDADLAYSRHFPSINWMKSYSLYTRQLRASWTQVFTPHFKEITEWWQDKFPTLDKLRSTSLELLNKASDIEAIARIIGETSLPDDQRLILHMSDIMKEGFLKQNAYDEVDSFCSPEKQVLLLDMILDFYSKAKDLIDKKVSIEKFINLPMVSKMKRIKEDRGEEMSILQLIREIDEELARISRTYGPEVNSKGSVSNA